MIIIARIIGLFSGTSPYVYIAIILASIATGWTVNGWRLNGKIDRMENERLEAVSSQAERVRLQEKTIQDFTNAIEVDHAKHDREISDAVARYRGLWSSFVRLRDTKNGSGDLSGKAPNSSVSDSQPSEGTIILYQRDYFDILDVATEANRVNELYATCRGWAYKVGRDK